VSFFESKAPSLGWKAQPKGIKTDTVGPNPQTGWKYPYKSPQPKRYRMKIESINWISKEAEEAEVTISDGHFTCIAFCQTCNIKVGDKITEPLHTFSIKNAMLSDKSTLGVWNVSETKLEKKVIAKILDITNQIVAVGDISLIIDDYLPGGLENGDIMEFECARIDLW
jgi:hypothetical protein